LINFSFFQGAHEDNSRNPSFQTVVCEKNIVEIKISFKNTRIDV